MFVLCTIKIIFHGANLGYEMNLAERLKQARESLSYTQKEMAKAASVTLQTWQVYEAGKSVPGGNVLEALARMGFNVNWILTGLGSMRLVSAGEVWSEKLKELRGDLTIPEFVNKLGFNDPEKEVATIQAIENEKLDPDLGLLIVLSTELGITIDWFFGSHVVPKMKKDISTGAGAAIDKELIKEALQAVEEYLQEVKGTLPPSKKAELVMLLCEWHLKEAPESKKINKATVIRLVRLAV